MTLSRTSCFVSGSRVTYAVKPTVEEPFPDANTLVVQFYEHTIAKSTWDECDKNYLFFRSIRLEKHAHVSEIYYIRKVVG